MKKFILVPLGLLFVCLLQAQCWINPDCSNPVSVTGILSNQNYNGSTCFDGSGIINNSVNVKDWDFLSYSGSLVVKGPVNMNNKTNVFANGVITFDQVHFTGGDTLFINGNVVISKVVSNNSSQDQRNVIMISSTSSLVVKGVVYAAGSTIVTPGNSKNEIDVQVCGDPLTLPVKFTKLSLSNGYINWTNEEQTGVSGYVIQGSNNGEFWTNVDTVEVNSSGTYSYKLNNTKLATFGLIGIIVLLGLLVPSKKLRIGAMCVAFIGFSLISCSKDAPEPENNTSYSLYRIQVLQDNGTSYYSDVVSWR